MAFRPYLFFGGNCREAFTRYQEIFGGELTLLTMQDVPGEEPPADKADMIIHAALTVGDDLLMASDDPMADDFGPVQGMMVSYDAADAADAKRVFDALPTVARSPRRSSRRSSRPRSACASTGSAPPGWWSRPQPQQPS